MLLEHPSTNVNILNRCGDSALHVIIQDNYADEEDHMQSVQLLLCHPSINIDQMNERNETPFDLASCKVKALETIDDNDRRKHLLPSYMETKKLLEDFPIKRKWQAYEYFFQRIEDWSVRN